MVKINSIVTFKYLVSDDEWAYKTVFISDDVRYQSKYQVVTPGSNIGKALLGADKGQIILIPIYKRVIIVDILYNIKNKKVSKDSIVKIDIFKDPGCQDFIRSEEVKNDDALMKLLVNQKQNEVIKGYLGVRGVPFYFIRIKHITSNREEQLLRKEEMEKHFLRGEFGDALKAVEDIEQFIVDSVDITEDTIDTFNKIVVCSLNVGLIQGAAERLSFILRFEIPSIERKRIKNILAKLKIIRDLTPIPVEEIKDYNVLISLGKLHKEVKAYDRAMLIYDKAISIDTSNPVAYNGLGGVHRQAKKYNEAIKMYEDAYMMKAQPAVPLTGLGAVYCDMDQMAKSEKCYNEALLLEPDSKYANNGLGAVYIKLNEIEKANECFLKSGDPYYWNSIAEKLYYEDRLDAALKCVEGLLSQFPNFRDATLTRKRILQELPKHNSV